MPVSTKDSEAAVRAYLSYLADPDSVLDQDEIVEAQRAVDAATDPIEKVLALTRLEAVSSVDEPALRKAFVSYAAGWCKRTGATGSALATFGVPADVLAEAKILAAANANTNGARAAPAATVPVPVRSTPPDHIDEIAKAVPVGKDFRAHEFAVLVGRNISTARGYLVRLINRGIVEEVGPDPNWSSRGAPPILFRRVGGESGI